MSLWSVIMWVFSCNYFSVNTVCSCGCTHVIVLDPDPPTHTHYRPVHTLPLQLQHTHTHILTSSSPVTITLSLFLTHTHPHVHTYNLTWGSGNEVMCVCVCVCVCVSRWEGEHVWEREWERWEGGGWLGGGVLVDPHTDALPITPPPPPLIPLIHTLSPSTLIAHPSSNHTYPLPLSLPL